MAKSTKEFLSQIKLSILSSSLKLQIFFLFLGIALVCLGLFLKNKQSNNNPNIEVQGNEVLATQKPDTGKIIVDISGAVVTPGVYSMFLGDRISDALLKAGGLSEKADKNWVDKNINKASKLVDGQKIYIPEIQQSNVLGANNLNNNSNVAQYSTISDSSSVNINTASLSQLETLPGIGQVYGQNIIDHRPYSEIGELLDKGILKPSTYNKIKDSITVY